MLTVTVVGLERLSARGETRDVELLKVGETFAGDPEPSQAARTRSPEGVETRRAAPKARTRYGEGIVQTTNARLAAAMKAVAGTKIRWGKPRAGSIPAARTTFELKQLERLRLDAPSGREVVI